MLRATVCILLSVGLFCPVAVGIYRTVTVTPADRERLSQRMVLPGLCEPEPAERLAYMAGVLFLPAAIFALTRIEARWSILQWMEQRPRIRWLLESGVSSVLLAVCGACYWWGQQSAISVTLFVQHPLLSLPLFAGCLALLWWGGGRRAGTAASLLAGSILAVVFLNSLFADNGGWSHGLIFNAVFGSVVQVHQGSILLHDAINQYGLFPHFLQPLFALTGLSVLTFTTVMGLLTVLSYGAVWLFLRREIASPVLCLVGFGALVFNSWFCFVLKRWHFEIYFQYMPIRFVVPAFFLLLAWLYFRSRRREVYWGILIFLSAGTLWNIDTGLPCLLTWLAVLGYDALLVGGGGRLLRQSVVHLLAAAGVLAGTVAAYAGAVFLACGAWPDLERAFYFQKVFYLSGFNMQAMHLPDVWVVVVLVYLAGFAYAAAAWTSGRNTIRARMVLLLSVLGTGLFSYFQGRSSLGLLARAWWPSFVLLVLFLDELLGLVRAERRRPLPWVLAALIAWVLSTSAVSIFPRLPQVGRWIGTNLELALHLDQSPARADAELLRAAVRPGEKLLVLSDRDAVLHLLAEVESILPCPLAQLVQQKEFLRLKQALQTQPEVKIFADREVLEGKLYHGAHTGKQVLIQMLAESYEVIGTTPRGCLYQRRGVPDRALAQKAGAE
jgi:hypothetical protein